MSSSRTSLCGCLCVTLMLVLISCPLESKKFTDAEKPDWAKKDIRDYNEADLERLLEQWDEDEEPLEDDELPEHLRKGPNIDLSQLDMSDPEAMLKLTKKGKTVMTFVQVDPSLSPSEVESRTTLWQTGLWNAHMQAEKYLRTVPMEVAESCNCALRRTLDQWCDLDLDLDGLDHICPASTSTSKPEKCIEVEADANSVLNPELVCPAHYEAFLVFGQCHSSVVANR
ncbi:unnamed protein product, partial [Cyprideis torosa]